MKDKTLTISLFGMGLFGFIANMITNLMLAN